MSTYDNSNSGVLFRNKNKREGDKQPDYRGNGEFGGVQFQISGWLKESKKTPGVKFLSLKLSEPYKAPDHLTQANADRPTSLPAAPKIDEGEEDVPF